MPFRLGRLLMAMLFLLTAPAVLVLADETEQEPRSIDQLIAALQDSTPEIRIQAITDLSERGEAARPAIPSLVNALQDQHSGVRMIATICLGELALDPELVMPALETAIDDSTVFEGRQMCLTVGLALGAYGAPAMPHLRRALASDKLPMRRGALVGLFRVGPPAAETVDELIVILEQGDPNLRGYVHQAIISIGPGAKATVGALITNLSSEDFHTQYWACRALGAIGSDAQPATDKLIELVQTSVASVRHNAATALGDIGPTVGPEAVQTLTDAFSDYSQIVRNKAVIALGKLQPLSLSAGATIERLLREPAQFSPRANAARVLFSMRPEAEEVVVKALLQDLIDGHEPELAASVLAEIDFDCDIVQRLIPLLEDENRYTRQYAAIALGDLGPAASDAEDALIQLLEDDAKEVREDAKDALEKITTLRAFEAVKANHPGLTCDVGVGLWAWPMPMDWDGDGDLDLVVSCPDKPYNGVYFFENTGDDPKRPIFEAAVRIGDGIRNPQVSYVDGQPRVLVPGKEYVDFVGKAFSQTKEMNPPEIQVGEGRVRANQWKLVDFDGDGLLDLVHGAGFWGDYGWDNAFDHEGTWTRGPLHGYVYIVRNAGTNDAPRYGTPHRLQADGKDVDVYGMPSPNFADYDGDGDLDLICGEFLDGFTYFENMGSRNKPVYKAGVYLTNAGRKVAMHVQMITPTAIDWDRDGDVDLVCGDEDGRVALVENTGKRDNGVPVFNQPAYFQQVADELKFGALVTPFSVDWDSDGDDDLVCGNTSGNIGFIENLNGGNPPKWANPVLLEAGGEPIHVQAGPNGSIQGPCEAKWGYTTLYVADWDQDGLLDLIVNSIWGKVVWFKNTGSKSKPDLAPAQPVEVVWSGKPPKPSWNWWDPASGELATQWRTTPCVLDWNEDGLNDLVMLDHDGYLAFYQRERRGADLVLLPGKRIFKGGVFDNKQTPGEDSDLNLLRLNNGKAGGSGRRKLCFADWDGDGDLDLLVNSVNISLLRNTGTEDGITFFQDEGPLGERRLAGHTTSPTVVDWDGDGVPDLVAGAEDGHFYYLPNPHATAQ